jgi:hypothetical protein
MVARMSWGVGLMLEFDGAWLDRLQPASASKTSTAADPTKRSPAMLGEVFLMISNIAIEIEKVGLDW